MHSVSNMKRNWVKVNFPTGQRRCTLVGANSTAYKDSPIEWHKLEDGDVRKVSPITIELSREGLDLRIRLTGRHDQGNEFDCSGVLSENTDQVDIATPKEEISIPVSWHGSGADCCPSRWDKVEEPLFKAGVRRGSGTDIFEVALNRFDNMPATDSAPSFYVPLFFKVL